MRKPRSVLVLLLLLVFNVSVVVPAEDVPETPYDESEALPYEGTPVFSIAWPRKHPRSAESTGSRITRHPFGEVLVNIVAERMQVVLLMLGKAH